MDVLAAGVEHLLIKRTIPNSPKPVLALSSRLSVVGEGETLQFCNFFLALPLSFP